MIRRMMAWVSAMLFREKERLRRAGLQAADLSELMPFARRLANSRENRDSHIGFVGYNKTSAGQQGAHRRGS